MAEQSINLPQIIAVALVGFFALRWFMSKPIGSASEPGQRPARNRNQVDPSKVEQVISMFPQYDRRTIAWDLQRNGGSVEATCHRLLQGPGLENPPPSFQPQLRAPTATPSATPSQNAAATVESGRPDLITRYNLHAKVNGKGKESVAPDGQQKKSAWSSDKAARADALRKRREEMVLAARRAMEAKDA